MEALIRLFLFFSLCGVCTAPDPAMYECPTGWEDHGIYCYRFMQDSVNLLQAKTTCNELGEKVFVLSINSDLEHTFIYDTLDNKYDSGSRKRNWWTSGRRMSNSDKDFMRFYWEGDGRPIESSYYWHDEESIKTEIDKDKIVYNYNGFKWGWILGKSDDKNPFVCKISKEDIYHITDTKRGPEYGWEGSDAALRPRAPKILEEPENMLFEMSILEMPDNVLPPVASFTCAADGYPAPGYSWYRQRTQYEEKLDPAKDERYTFVGGRLVINQASDTRNDSASYWCRADNEYGAVLSTRAFLDFGFIGDFSRDKRSPVSANMHKEAIIDCTPPKVSPESSMVAFEWYKTNSAGDVDYVRSDVKPYIFISWDGKLYFSEVTTEDDGYYYCKVSRPGVTTSSGATSPNIQLEVQQSSPGEYEPTILSSFPHIYPSKPKVGDEIRIECFAAGTSEPPLKYTWARFERIGETSATGPELKMPKTLEYEDHNRVLIIRKTQIYDAGVYRCRVEREYGKSTYKDVDLNLLADPYFVIPLEDQLIDVGTDMLLRCEADGRPTPTYRWLKDGEVLTNGTANIKVFQNTIQITNAKAEVHNGIYQCEARSQLSIKYTTAEVRVIEFAPTFAKWPLQVNQFATAKGNSTIICQPEGAPQPDITWYKNGVQLVSDGRVEIMANGNLFLTDIHTTDTGKYKCRAENSQGVAESGGNFTVLSTVTITKPPETPIGGFRVNHTNILHCIASYDRKLDVTYVWYQGDTMIEFEKVYRLGENRYDVWYDPHFKRGTGYYMGALYFMNAQYSHNGKYTCMVEDTNGGKVSNDVDVIVLGPPYEPAGVLVVDKTVTNVSVQIQFIPAGNNGGTITSFLIESFNHWEGFWRIHETNVPAPIQDDSKMHIILHTVEGLRPNTTYRFRIRAENMYGTSEPSDPSGLVSTSPVPPDIYPRRLGGGGGKEGTLTIRWEAMKRWEFNGPGFHYIVYHKPAGDKEFKCVPNDKSGCVTVGNDTSHATIMVGQDLYYMPYDIAIQAVNIMGPGPMSTQVTIRSAMTLPDAIAKNIQIRPHNATACVVTWHSVEDEREKVGGALGGYRRYGGFKGLKTFWKQQREGVLYKVAYWERERYGTGIMEDAPRITINGQASEGMVIGLWPDTYYMFGVYVWNDAGNGPITDPFPQRTLRRAPINQPVEVKVFQLSHTSIRITWRGVSTTNVEEPLTGYKVRIWRQGDDIKEARENDYEAKKEIELVVRDLNPDMHYKLRVYGYSRGGEGLSSSPAVKFHLGAAGYIKASGVLVFLMAVLSILKSI